MDAEKSKCIDIVPGFGFLLLLMAALYSPVVCARDGKRDLVVARDGQQQRTVSSFLDRIIGESDEIVEEPNEMPGEPAAFEENIWYAGTWDSFLYLNIRYPRTVAIRLKLLDQETHQPIKNSRVSLRGEYMQTLTGLGVRNRIDMKIFPDLRKVQPQRHKFALDTVSDSNGIVVFSLNWQKEYSWQDKTRDQESRSLGVVGIARPDGIDCAVRAQIRHPDYKYIELLVDFKHVANQKPGEDASDDDERQISERRRGEIEPRSVRAVVLDLGNEFSDFKNKRSRRSEFFEKIQSEDYSMAYKDIKSSTELEKKSKCGPYFVYDLGEVLLERVTPRVKVKDLGGMTQETETSDQVSVLVKDTNDLEEVQDSQQTKSPEKPIEPSDQIKTDTSAEPKELKDSPEATQPSKQSSPITSAITEEPKESMETVKPADQTKPVISALAKEPQAEGAKEVEDTIQPKQAEEKVYADLKEKIIDLGDGVTMKLLFVPAGTFQMGSGPDKSGSDSDEGPVHEVRIAKPFYMSVYEVTQEQYEKVMKTNPSRYKSPKYPVNMVSWYEAREFCRMLSSMVGGQFRLPTEAEWEYACRAGTTTTYYWGDSFDDRYAWCLSNSGMNLHEVGTRLPNAWGLYDMSGNLWEWCEDSYNERYTSSNRGVNRRSVTDEPNRVLRGGSWNVSHEFSRSANRSKNAPDTRKDYDGFRVVLDVNGN